MAHLLPLNKNKQLIFKNVNEIMYFWNSKACSKYSNVEQN